MFFMRLKYDEDTSDETFSLQIKTEKKRQKRGGSLSQVTILGEQFYGLVGGKCEPERKNISLEDWGKSIVNSLTGKNTNKQHFLITYADFEMPLGSRYKEAESKPERKFPRELSLYWIKASQFTFQPRSVFSKNTGKDIFCFWGVNIQSVIGFSLITSLYLIYNLNTLVVFFGTLLGSLLVYFFSNWIGKPSQKFGLPFVVLLRSPLGVRGSKYFGMIRGLVGIFMFGIQTYFLSKAFGYLIRIFIFSYDQSYLDNEIFLIFILGMNIIDWFSIIISVVIQTLLFNSGMIFNKRLIQLSALSVYLGMLLFFFSVLEIPPRYFSLVSITSTFPSDFSFNKR